MAIKKKKKLREGQSKIVYETEAPEQLVLAFKDEIPGTNGTKGGVIENRGVINNRISTLLFRYVESYNIPTHFFSSGGKDAMIVRPLEMIRFSVRVHSIASAAVARRLGVKEGTPLEKILIEYHRKEEGKKEALVSREELPASSLVTADELAQIDRYAAKVNAVLKSFFTRRGLSLFSVSLAFGRYKNRICLGDELSFENFVLQDAKTGEKYDFDRLRDDLKTYQSHYEHLSRRILLESQ